MNDFKYKPKHVVVKKKYTYIALAPALKQYRRGRLLTLYVQSPFPVPTLICLGSYEWQVVSKGKHLPSYVFLL